MKILIEKEYSDLEELLESGFVYTSFGELNDNDTIEIIEQYYYLPYVFKKLLDDGRLEMIHIKKLNNNIKTALEL